MRFFTLVLLGVAVLATPARALDRTQLAVVINTRDPLSVRIGDYYAASRSLLFQNVVRVSFPPGRTDLTPSEFEAVKAQLDKQTNPRIQAYALTWALPFRVGCMSITAAFAFGFDPAYCADGCKPTRPSPYFDSSVLQPFTELKMRPTMAIAALSFNDAKRLIDRGVQSDATFPSGTAYLLSTTDKARNVRSKWYPMIAMLFGNRLRVRVLQQDVLEDEDDVLFYFTGKQNVEGLSTLRFVPGAIADHLTSTGGVLVDGGQMSALRWLEAGATGSYGTVVEPCNFAQKFPHPLVVIGHYTAGETLIESYWKSVRMPGQGIFIGEPLARPFGRLR